MAQAQKRSRQQLSVWYDEEGDYLEIAFEEGEGFFQDAGEDLWLRVNPQGRIVGFAILNFSKQAQQLRRIKLPLTVSLAEST